MIEPESIFKHSQEMEHTAFLGKIMDQNYSSGMTMLEGLKNIQTLWTGLFKYAGVFMEPVWPASQCLFNVEAKKIWTKSPLQTLLDYTLLNQMNFFLLSEGGRGAVRSVSDFYFSEIPKVLPAFIKLMANPDDKELLDILKHNNQALNILVHEYPKAVKAAKNDFGVHLDRKDATLVAETDRFYLYQINPSDKNMGIQEDGKPVLVIPPYVLGSNILMFLRGQKKSYVNAFADQGIPTYLRVLKEVAATPAVQTMSPEDDCTDMACFLKKIKDIHKNKVTLNGYCQGGFVALTNLLSGELDTLVDALITCVSPIDGTKSNSLKKYYSLLPPRYRDMEHSVKILPSGNKVVDGRVMSWVYKIMSMEKESPVASFYRDFAMFYLQKDQIKINPTAAALNYWLFYERTDIPKKICDCTFATYNNPIGNDGTLPVTLFDRKLNFNYLKEKNISYHISIAQKDDLVDGDCARAPLKFIDAELCVFPKGHLGIATSWSHPDSEYALQKRFKGKYRGPVRFHMDLAAQANK
ncbi:MAG: alpha/beta hydrolase [Desulfobacteraceae bacterium]|nr:alpha/beta hydrolase [Desulfobacteraceae bacterium]